MDCNEHMNQDDMNDPFATMNCMIKGMFGPGLRFHADADEHGMHLNRVPRMDVQEDDARYLVTMNLPGVSKEHVTITSEDNGITVKTTEEEHADSGALRTIYRERFGGTYHRSMRFEEPIDASGIGAHLENGVLQVNIPKKKDESTHTIHVD